VRSLDAIIVGAGPAGSAAAILLARAGWSVALVEKERFPRRKVCGECIAASNLPLLEALGIGSAVEAAAGPALREVALMRGEACVIAPLPPAADARFRWGRALGRETLDALLLERAAQHGVKVLQPCAVERWERKGALWSCALRNADGAAGMHLRAPVLIDAHGSWDSLRLGEGGGTTRPRAASDLFAFKANFLGASLAPGVLPVLAFTGGYGGMVIADNALATLACCVRRDRLAQWRAHRPGTSAGAAVETMLRAECGGVDRALARAERVGPWLAVGPLAPGIRVDDDDGVFRIGNAAGEAHPILGEGLSMALQSAALLAAQMIADPPAAQPLVEWRCRVGRAYARAWRRKFVQRHRVAAAFAHVAMRPLLSASLLALVRAYPGVLSVGARWGGKIEPVVLPST
jgi:2-polyprenyl-6-methoxyphenol hydroxylase-like FAD-dependent oxidoreductase